MWAQLLLLLELELLLRGVAIRGRPLEAGRASASSHAGPKGRDDSAQQSHPPRCDSRN